jgi:hypothetical protein
MVAHQGLADQGGHEHGANHRQAHSDFLSMKGSVRCGYSGLLCSRAHRADYQSQGSWQDGQELKTRAFVVAGGLMSYTTAPSRRIAKLGYILEGS